MKMTMVLLLLFVSLASCRTPEIDLTVRDGETSRIRKMETEIDTNRELINKIQKLQSKINRNSDDKKELGLKIDILEKKMDTIRGSDEYSGRTKGMYEALSRVVLNLDKKMQKTIKELDERVIKVENRVTTFSKGIMERDYKKSLQKKEF